MAQEDATTRHRTPVKRHLFTLLSAVSLVLCAGVVAAWVMSHFYQERIVVQHINPGFPR